ncbi:MAG TPA: type II toxin-antitoxin system VapC family toxin [Longimicrobiales bacterium]|nr:type II toxin-antitoxin system VapC family toxin [Longimicrobiales bacterium]
MTFVDTNVFMYAVGRDHPLKEEARGFLLEHVSSGDVLATSAEVIQELLHAYLPVGRLATLDAALSLARARMGVIWAVEWDDVQLARSLVSSHPGLGARDLLHVACCTRRGVERVKTFDRALAAAFG